MPGGAKPRMNAVSATNSKSSVTFYSELALARQRVYRPDTECWLTGWLAPCHRCIAEASGPAALSVMSASV